MRKFIKRFMFAWHYAYNTKKWQAFTEQYNLKDPEEEKIMESIKRGTVIKGHGDDAQSEVVVERLGDLVWTRTLLGEDKVSPINQVQAIEDLKTYGYTVQTL